MFYVIMFLNDLNHEPRQISVNPNLFCWLNYVLNELFYFHLKEKKKRIMTLLDFV